MPYAVTTPKYERSKTDKINGITYHRSYSQQLVLGKLLQRVPFLREQVMMRQVELKVRELIQQLNVDVVHAHSPSLCGLPALKVARQLGKSMVYEVRAFWEDAAVDRNRFAENSFKYRLSSRTEQKLFDQADAVVCICEGLRGEIARRTNNREVIVVPNGVDTAVFVPREKSQHLIEQHQLHGKVVVGFIGSFFTFEGLADLLQSMPLVRRENKNIVALIVGAGVENHNLRKQAEILGEAGKSIIFTGHVPHEQVQDYYSVMDILVYPRISKRITELVTPLKPLEAMAMEKTVLVSDVGGLRELVDDERNGFVFKSGDVNDLASKLIHLAANPDRCLEIGHQARKDMIAHRDWSVIVNKYPDIYQNVCRVVEDSDSSVDVIVNSVPLQK
ncbi:hypothetical protein JCM31598_27580 [Desulfonatronum parangueonense]